MTQIIFSDETPKGWIPPSIAAPFICIFIFAISMTPFDIGLEYLGLTDAMGSPLGPLGFCLMLASFVAVGLAVSGWVRWVEKRSLASVGLRGEQRLKKFLIGLAVGIAMMGAIVTAIALSGGYRVADLAPAFASPAALGWIALLLAGFAVQASVEEFVFRGWLFSTIMRRWNTTAAFILSSAAFTFLHFSPRTSLLMLAMTFIFAIFACAWVRRSNSIWGVMGWHVGWNWFGGTGFDVPITGLDTGLPALVMKMVPVGPAWLNGAGEGPEASVFTLALLTVAGLSLLLLPTHRGRDGIDPTISGQQA
ncbi:type II CAAX endopeptidase family protein [Allopontixanthobacter sp.]|uniref:CPBP family intramembrane glutamic endopeptidase n=1 Tax=Allopontixanthobacter sp. TaxID=2906452 RepID=UPI002ABAEA2E|nr:type II CAAX endopeptidase family protein [Allopontixanthobacter sp.]MDZ4306562.1 type II CAAX endopeptidase family protein [Allopontixanthobacter sp.]